MAPKQFPRPALGQNDNSRLREAQAALEASEARLRRAQDLGGAFPYEWDLATDTLIVHQGIGRLYGLKEGEPVTYEAVTSRVHPDDRPRVRAAHRAALAAGGPYEQEYRVLQPDGSVRWVLARGEPVHAEDGTPQSLAGVVLEITARKEAELLLKQREAQLAESERRFRVLADTMPQMVWSTRPDGYHDYFNRRWYEFTGVPEGSTDGEEWNGMFHPDDQEHAWERWRHSLATGEPYEIEYRLRHRSGGYRWVLGRALPMRNERGRIERWFGTCTDIHGLKQTEQALAESEEFTRRLLASSDDCIKVLDLEANLRFMSEGGKRVMEVDDFSRIEGCRWTEFWTGPAADEARKAVETARAGGTGRFRGFCPTVAGTPKWWDVIVTPIDDPTGKPHRLLSVSRDITDMQRTEAELREREALLSSIFQSEGLFTSVVELREEGAVYVLANERTAQFFGLTSQEIAGKSLGELGVAPEEAGRWVGFMRECCERGEPVTMEYPFQAGGRSLYCLGTFTPLPKELSERPRLSLVTLDISERKRLEEQQALVTRELHHRIKNSLATVGAVVSSTARHAQTVNEYRQAVTDRITSLAKTHTLLIENSYGGASLHDILLSELKPYDDEEGTRVRLKGPKVQLPPEIAVAFGMAVHELTTNAAKYGAFSLPTGCVCVTWAVEPTGDERHLSLEWEERDGPPVEAPDRQGFGSVLLQRALGRQLGGVVETSYAPEGLRVRITAALPAR